MPSKGDERKLCQDEKTAFERRRLKSNAKGRGQAWNLNSQPLMTAAGKGGKRAAACLAKARSAMSVITPLMAALLSVCTLGIFGVAYALLDDEKSSEAAGSDRRLDRS